MKQTYKHTTATSTCTGTGTGTVREAHMESKRRGKWWSPRADLSSKGIIQTPYYPALCPSTLMYIETMQLRLLTK